MKDILTAKISIEGEFEALQALRQALADPTMQQRLTEAIRQAACKVLGGDLPLETALEVPQYRETQSGSRDPIPRAEKGEFFWYDPYAQRRNIIGRIGGENWFAWLADPGNTSFRYVARDGTGFTAIKNAKGYWIAHKRLDGRLRRKYLGRPENLTARKLDGIAFILAQRRLA